MRKLLEGRWKLGLEYKKILLSAYMVFISSYAALAQTGGSNLKPHYNTSKRAYGFIDTTSGKKVISYKYLYAGGFNEGVAVVNAKNGFGIINAQDETVLPFEYTSIDMAKCPEVVYILKKVDKKQTQYIYGLADAKGSVILPCEYDKISLAGNIFKVEKRLGPATPGLGIVNKKGQFIAPLSSKNFPEPNFYWGVERIAFEKDGQVKYGAINNQGSIVIPFEYKDMFVNPKLIVATDFNSKCHIFNIAGKKLSDVTYDEFSTKGSYNPISNSEIRVKKDGKIGLFGESGLIVPCLYDEIPDGFSNGFLTVKINNMAGLVNRQGKLIVPCEYESAFYYYKTKQLYVYRHKKTGYFNIGGSIILPCEFNSIPDSLVGGCFVFPKNGKYGMVDTTGKMIVPFVLDEAFVNSSPAQALTYCQTIAKVNPENKDIIYLLALAYYVSKPPADVIKELTSIINANTSQKNSVRIPGVYYYRLLAYLKMNDLDKAYGDCLYTNSSAEKEWSCKAYTEIANARFKAGKYKEALGDCRSAKYYAGDCGVAIQLEADIKNEMALKGIPIEEGPKLVLGKTAPKRNIFYIGDDRKNFPANWPEPFFWNPSEQLKNKFEGDDCNCEISNFNPNYAGHDNNYFDLRCSKIVDAKDIFGNFTGWELETNSAYFLKSIERTQEGDYIFYAEGKDGPISYKKGLRFYYKSKDEISFRITINNKMYEMKTRKSY